MFIAGLLIGAIAGGSFVGIVGGTIFMILHARCADLQDEADRLRMQGNAQ